MKAFIFNSGSGQRMGPLTKATPKGLVKLYTGESILERQLRLLRDIGIKNIVISTGPFSEQIEQVSSERYRGLSFTFVNNPLYAETNSIYSMLLAEDTFDDDFLIMHGDLIFDRIILEKLFNHPANNVCLINSYIQRPKKDFKGRVENNLLRRIAVDMFTEQDIALQPLYKFSLPTIKKWLVAIKKMVEEKNVQVYAENALNTVLNDLNVECLDYKDHYIDEVDDEADLYRVSLLISQYDYVNQHIIETNDYLNEVKSFLFKNNLKRPLVIHSQHLIAQADFNLLLKEQDAVTFTDYSPNPKYEEALAGLALFKEQGCDSIVAIGGGSCIDVAKAIKLFSGLNPDKHFLEQAPRYVDLKFVAVPTTAGTGTESTRYAVLYFKDDKQTLTNDSLVSDLCLLNEKFLENLPPYYKKASLLDAFCQAIEAYWSVNANERAKEYAEKAIRIILQNYRKYIENDHSSNKEIMRAANLAGRAINITQTTAPHAMSYKITTLTGVAHGHAVSLCLPYVYEYMLSNINQAMDPRGATYVLQTFKELATLFNINENNLTAKLKAIIGEFNLQIPEIDREVVDILATSVNAERLKNSPVYINERNVKTIYLRIFNF